MDEETPKKREFLFSTSVQYAAQSGVDDPCVDTARVSLHLRLVDLVVLAGTGAVAYKYPLLDGCFGLGGTVRK